MVGAFLVSYIPDRFQFEPEYRFLVFGLALIILMSGLGSLFPTNCVQS